jgi:major intracellular serine protease
MSLTAIEAVKQFSVFSGIVVGLSTCASNAEANRPFIIAVIDSGIHAGKNTHLCKYGHKSFVSSIFPSTRQNPLYDEHGHGTHVAGIIEKNAGKSNYCIVSVKFWSPGTNENSTKAMIDSIQYAINIKVDAINISAGGLNSSEEEKAVIKSAIDKGITIFAAAGNEASNLDLKCNYFPACYDDRIISVGNLRPDLTINSVSNFGNFVKRWEIGTDIESTVPTGLMTMSGTSQATAVISGKFIKNLK